MRTKELGPTPNQTRHEALSDNSCCKVFTPVVETNFCIVDVCSCCAVLAPQSGSYSHSVACTQAVWTDYLVDGCIQVEEPRDVGSCTIKVGRIGLHCQTACPPPEYYYILRVE